MWMPKKDEAVEIYAHYLIGRHGKSAHEYARKTAGKLQRNGDLQGYTTWSRVAEAVERKAGKNVNVETVTSVS